MFQSEVKSQIYEDISILVKPDNHPFTYICECGDARDLTVKEIQSAQAIFISHTHIDHFVNFDAMVRHQIGIQRRVTIIGPEGIAKQVQHRIQSYTWNLIQEGAILYEIREVISDTEMVIYEIEPPHWELKEIKRTSVDVLFNEKTFMVTGVLLDHKIPTLAYKFIEHDTLKINIKESGFRGGPWVNTLKEAYTNHRTDISIDIEGKTYLAKDLYHLLHIQKGDTLGIIMDHAAHSKNHIKIKTHFKDCAKVFIECFYKAEDESFAHLNSHSFSTMSAQIMKESEVKEALPVHFSRKYTKDEVCELIEEFDRVYRS